MKLSDLLTGSPHHCGPETTLAEAATEMARLGLGSLAVVDGHELLGVITERDLVRALATRADGETETVNEWMGAEPDRFAPDTDVWDAAEWLLEAGYRHLPVVENGRLLGVVSIRDLLRGVVESAE